MLDEPKISWLVKCPEDKEYSQDENFYAGSYNKRTDLELDFVIWNNKYGEEKVQDLKSFCITVSFETLEDSSLLEYCIFEYRGKELSTSIDDGVMSVVLPSDAFLSGGINDGTDQHTDNYITLKMKLSVPKKYMIKANDLKTLLFNIVKI